MATQKKCVLMFTDVPSSAILADDAPVFAKLKEKGCVCPLLDGADKLEIMAASGAEEGETLWAAAEAAGLRLGSAPGEGDMLVVRGLRDPTALRQCLADTLERADRGTLLALVSPGAAFFHGFGAARGVRLDKPASPTAVAPTIAYILNYPVPAQAEGPILYAALKDRNMKRRECIGYQESIDALEHALERNSRQPWDKHDCA